MTVNHPNEKAADVLAHVNGEASTYPEETMNQHTASQAHEIRLEDGRKSTGIEFVTLSGDRLSVKEYRRVVVPWELILAAHRDGAVTVTISADDVIGHDRRIAIARAEREQRERDAQILAEAKARALAEAEDLLNNLDLQELTSQ